MIGLMVVSWGWNSLLFKSKWDERLRFNVWLVDENKVGLLSFEGDSARWIKFEGRVVIPIDGTEGEVKLSSVLKFAETNKGEGGVMRRSLDKWMRLVSDGVFWKTEKLGVKEALIKSSNLSLRDRMKLAGWFASGGKVEEVSITGEEETTIDDQRVVRIDVDKLLRQNREWWSEDEVLSDKRRVRLIIEKGDDFRESVLGAAGVVIVEKTVVDQGRVGRCEIKLPEGDRSEEGIPLYVREKFGCKVGEEESGDLEIELVF